MSDRPAGAWSVRRFTEADQARFAEASGDRNPLHVDAVFARRLLFGRPVVHGIHLVLWALDWWMRDADAPIALRRLRVEFVSPVAVDDEVRCEVRDGDGNGVRLVLSVGGARAATITAAFDPAPMTSLPFPSGPREPTELRALLAADLPGAAGTTPLWPDAGAGAVLWPSVARLLPALQVAELLATTRIVGMLCPGLHSVYSSLALTFGGDVSDPGRVRYATSSFDDRFSRVTLDLSGGDVAGTLTAFLRPTPKEQEPYAGIASRVRAGEFAGERALVVGGSRGLGEAVVKLLAAGGADVRLTFQRGRDEALAIEAEIRRGGGSVTAAPYDVLGGADDLLTTLGDWRPSHLYYFATPPIFVGARGRFSRETYERFSRFYVEGFHEIVRVLSGADRLRHAFYPSSVALDELPPDMMEYVCAKAAGEALCDVLRRTEPRLRVTSVRLPRMETDQTRTIFNLAATDPAPYLLDLLRAMHAPDLPSRQP